MPTVSVDMTSREEEFNSAETSLYVDDVDFETSSEEASTTQESKSAELVALLRKKLDTHRKALARERLLNEKLRQKLVVVPRSTTAPPEGIDAAQTIQAAPVAEAPNKQKSTQTARNLPDNASLANRVEALQKSNKVLNGRIDVLKKRLDVANNGVAKLREERGELIANRKLAEAKSVHSVFTMHFAQGESLEKAAIKYTEALLANGERLISRSFAQALMNRSDTHTIGKICCSIQAAHDLFRDHASELISDVPWDILIELAPVHLIACLLHADPIMGAQEIDRLLADSTIKLDPKQWWQIAELCGGKKMYFQLGQIVTRLTGNKDLYLQLDEADKIALDWTARHLRKLNATLSKPARKTSSVKSRQKPKVINLGIVDYKMLDRQRASSNVGDYVQTLAMLSNVARFENLQFPKTDLGGYLESLKGRVAADRRISTKLVTVEPVPVDRDFSNGQDIPELTWMPAFGWYMHPNFREHFDFPFHRNIRPFFLSFHINRPEMLSSEAVEYLRRYEPIGCRDWTTVYLMRQNGVKAFFSGCMTTTIGQIFSPPPPETGDAPMIAIVDYTPQAEEFPGYRPVKFTQAADNVRDYGMFEGLEAADRLLDGYRAFSAIATSRLHCYLPATSIGVKVHFRPRKRTDIRFEGLLDLDVQGFNAIRHRIEDLTKEMFTVIFSGADEKAVYQRWREITAAHVAYAETYCNQVAPYPSPSFDVEAVCKLARNTGFVAGTTELAKPSTTADIAVALDQNLKNYLPPLLESIVANTDQRLRINVLARNLDQAYFDQLAKEFPELELRVFDFTSIDYGGHLRMLSHTSVSTMDRLLLPDLLSDVQRLVYLDIDVTVVDSIDDLLNIDLAGHSLAGKTSTFVGWRTGQKMVYRAAATLDAHRCWDLRRRMHRDGPLNFPAFNAGVLVMDLDRMRADDFSAFALPLIENFGMNDQDALNVYARFNRVELDQKWNAVPSQENCNAARILHYAGPVKAWGDLYIQRKEDYLKARLAYEARREARSARTLADAD